MSSRRKICVITGSRAEYGYLYWTLKEIQRILMYETLSETNLYSSFQSEVFQPNVYVDIHPYLDKKIEIMKHYASKIEDFPFPRSEKAIRSLAF